MSNKTSLIMALTIVGAVVLDLVVNGGGVLFFLTKKFFDLIDALAVWR